MILLIAGASHTGKTLLAQKLLEKWKMPYLSIDHLKMGLIRSGLTDLSPEDDEELTMFLWPVVREMIRTALENRQNLIVEGCYVPFDWRTDFDEADRGQIRDLWLVMDPAYIESRFGEIQKHACDIERRQETDCDKRELIQDNLRILEACQEHGLPYLFIENEYPRDLVKLAEDRLQLN